MLYEGFLLSPIILSEKLGSQVQACPFEMPLRRQHAYLGLYYVEIWEQEKYSI